MTLYTTRAKWKNVFFHNLSELTLLMLSTLKDAPLCLKWLLSVCRVRTLYLSCYVSAGHFS